MPTNHNLQNPAEDHFLTVVEVADRLRVSHQTVRNWIARGALPALRVGPRRIRVRQADLDRFIQTGYTGGGAARRQLEPHPDEASEELAASCQPRHELEVREGFLAAALGLIRAATGGGERSELAAALVQLASAAYSWADALAQPGR